MSPDVFRRLHLELSAWYAGVFIALLLGLGLLTYGHMASALVRGADDLNRRALADVLEGIIVRGERLAVSPADFAEEAEEARTLFDVTLVQLVDAQGRLIARSGDARTPVLAAGPEHETVRLGGGEWRLLRHPVTAGERRLGTLVLGHDMRERGEALAGLSRDLLVLGPTGALLTLAAGLLLAGKALRPIRDAFERQRRFIADASHELRTPITIIQAQVEAGRQGAEAEARAGLDAIGRTSERMGRLVADLLLLTRADAASLGLESRAFFLDELAEELVDDLRPLGAARGVTLRFERRSEDVSVSGDPERLRQLVLNLLDNALAHTPPAGEVVVWVERQRTGAALGVRDTGGGIAPEDLPRVFDRFYRAASAARPGAGLGLAIARAIAEAHGGQLSVSSPPGRGAEFVLHLPGAEA